jgi:hypothetical protein
MSQLLIEPIVEYLPIVKTPSKSGKALEILSVKSLDGKDSIYLNTIKEDLMNNAGIYVFYDSIGRAIYVGRATKMKLWAEACNAFNRDRKNHQLIWGVNHPTSNVKKVINNRKIVQQPVVLHEISHYFSAYKIAEEHINTLEAFLIRAFANNLMNKRIENFKLTGGVGTVPAEET